MRFREAIAWSPLQDERLCSLRDDDDDDDNDKCSDDDDDRDAKGSRYGRYICTILSKVVLIFGPCTDRNRNRVICALTIVLIAQA